MITITQFILLIHLALIGLYLFEIGRFIHDRIKYPNPFIHTAASDMDRLIRAALERNGLVLWIAFPHTLIVAFTYQGVPILLMLLVGVSYYAHVRNTAVADYLADYKARKAREGPRAEGRRDNDRRGKEDTKSQGAGEGRTKEERVHEADYESALRDAHAEAMKVSDEAAARFAAYFEKHAQESGLHPKIRLYRQLTAMLLRERAKGYKAAAGTV